MSRHVVLYDASDSAGEPNLWSTNATAAGTFEIGGLESSGISGASVGLNPQYLTVFHNEVVFSGQDNSPYGPGLWITNGTAAGTHEIGGQGSTNITDANPDGLGPGGFAVFGNELLFRGEAGTGGNETPGLWVTDGTAAGTFEVGGNLNAGISYASPGGLIPGFVPGYPLFTVFNGEALFTGRDADGNQGLWVTNGTAPGTFELTNIPGAFSVGPPGTPGTDVMGALGNMTVLGNEVVFRGNDQQDTNGSLWVTNGQQGGTFEVGGQLNAGIAEAPSGTGTIQGIGMVPNDITTFNGHVLFAGFDNTLEHSLNGYNDTDALWISDGTPGGTTEIGGAGNAGISGANSAASGGIFWYGNVEYPDFTVYGNEVLFVGFDDGPTAHVGLWVTNGTAAGTSEIGGIGNSGISGGLNLYQNGSPDFTLYNGEVLFHGEDGSGHQGLWITNGTAAGTHEITTPDLGLPGPDGNFFTPFTYQPQVDDFNGDGVSDLLWRNTSGEVDTWLVTNGQVTGGTVVSSVSTAWRFAGAGDITGNGTSDVVWQNASTGAVESWLINNGHLSGGTGVGHASSVWQPLGTGDFNADGISDLLWRSSTTGEVDTWLINNGQLSGGAALGSVSSAWQFAGIGDFIGNAGTGASDVLWHNTTTGEVDTWLITNDHLSGGTAIGHVSSVWQSLGTGDFNGDGTSDILWRNTSNGQVDTWLMNNGQVSGGAVLGTVSSAWQFVGIGDYTGSGTSDILWRNTATGEVDTWLITNDQLTGGTAIGTASTAWQPQVIHTS
jgi:ELWxxDGT repeat protein